MSNIYLSGEINNDLARYFAYEMNWAESPVTVHINSYGGDPFAAIAIAHTIRHSEKDISLSVEGLCCSAAILILCSGRKVLSAFNSLFMIHGVSVMLEDCYNLSELEKVKSTLEKMQESIEKTLATRLKDVDLSKEQWLSADEALSIGLIDEITSAQVDIKVDNKQKLIFANNHFFKIKNGMPEVPTMDNMQLRNQVRQEELTRIRALQKLKCDNAAVNAIVDVAISKGHNVSDVKGYIDAVQATKPPDPLRGLIADQMNSGAAGVTGGEVDVKAAQVERMIALAKKRSENHE